MADDTYLLDQVSEREIDFALLSSLYASKVFRSFVLERAAGWDDDHEFVRARLSDWDGGRETDVLLIVDLSDGTRLAIMIEDKISASFQPDQAIGYRERGESGIRDYRWHRCVTCLFAPESYIQYVIAAREWDSYISFESVIRLSEDTDDRNIAFVASICRQGVAKRAAGLLPVSEIATEFWRAYRQLADELLPQAPVWRMAEHVSHADQWPRFGKLLFPANIWIDHKSVPGTVDLHFDKMAIEYVASKIAVDLPLGVTLAKTGGSTALRIRVDKINSLRPFHDQRDEVEMALTAVKRLLALWEHIAPLF